MSYLLTQALALLEEATSYTSCETWSPSLTDEINSFVINARAAMAATPAPAPRWAPVTEKLFTEDSGLDGPLWIAMKDGGVRMGTYKWRQGGKPDRFVGPDIGDIWALDATHVMPIEVPQPPGIGQGKEASNA